MVIRLTLLSFLILMNSSAKAAASLSQSPVENFKQPPGGSTIPQRPETLILSGKIIAKNQHLFAMKPRQGKAIKMPVTVLRGKYAKSSKGDSVTIEVPLSTYERFNHKKNK